MLITHYVGFILEHSIAIFEKDRQKRDFIRKKISATGYIPVCFENEGICLENIWLINPAAVLFEPNSVETASRFLNLVSIVKNDLPILFFSNRKKIRQYLKDQRVTEVNLDDDILNKDSIHQKITALKKKGKKIRQVIAGSSPEIVRIQKMISVLGNSNEPILIQGENGTGKELVARSILSWSGNPDPYSIKIDASQLTCKDIEGELFCLLNDGAQNENNRKKIIGNRTIVLNELEKLSPNAQSELLLMVESLNKNSEIACSYKNNGLRFISTANDNIGSLIENGGFRKDLYYRLGVLKLNIPPLRERIEDIPALADYFGLKFSLGQNKTYYKLPGRIKEMFLEHHWPGNVQELLNIVKRLVVNEDEASIVSHLKTIKGVKGDLCKTGANLMDEYVDEIEEVKENLSCKKDIHLKKIREEISSKTEKKLLSQALYKTNWNRKKAAEMLKISYKALLNKIKMYKLDQN